MRNALTRRPALRTVILGAAMAGALALGACTIDDGSPTAKAMRPLSDKILHEMADKNMAKDAPILVRIFKEEAELEVWKQDKSGRYALLKTYPICRWSGELGPKFKEGDRQAPEGFYTIAPGQMNPNSSYYLSFNIGYPNTYDRAWNRTGSELMIHGDCSSRGCYAMTDEQIGEIYALAREAFFGGQKAFQVQAFPFRMTPANMARHRNSPHMAFWRMLKQGYDHFEVTHLEPKVNVCERKYVFDAGPADPSKPLKFNATAACPAYQIDPDIMAAVSEKEQRDEAQFKQLADAGVATAPVRTGRDGGMNPVFLAALNQPSDGLGNDGAVRSLAPFTPVPGTIPAHTVPPGANGPASPTLAAPLPDTTPKVVTASEADKAPARVASRESKKSDGAGGSMFDKLGKLIGLRGSDGAKTMKQAKAARPEGKTEGKTAAKPASHAATRTASAVPTAPLREPPLRPAASVPATTSASADAKAQAQKSQPQKSQPETQTIAGAQPMLPTASFSSRFGAFR